MHIYVIYSNSKIMISHKKYTFTVFPQNLNFTHLKCLNLQGNVKQITGYLRGIIGGDEGENTKSYVVWSRLTGTDRLFYLNSDKNIKERWMDFGM